MSLDLDRRQRAMLEEMGVTVWWPDAASPAVPPAADSSAASPPVAAEPMAAAPVAIAPSPAAAPPRPPAPAAAPAPSKAHGDIGPGFALAAPRLLYSGVDADATPPHLGAGWLVVTEALPEALDDPFAGDAGRLLDNMLRALQLHRHPRVYLAALTRQAGGTGAPVADQLAAQLADLRPAVVLLMGRAAAQAML
ncbi:MAG TPA: uracil-DNA glycosylase family protein, partial [Burkholderiaceae bacterium]